MWWVSPGSHQWEDNLPQTAVSWIAVPSTHTYTPLPYFISTYHIPPPHTHPSPIPFPHTPFSPSTHTPSLAPTQKSFVILFSGYCVLIHQPGRLSLRYGRGCHYCSHIMTVHRRSPCGSSYPQLYIFITYACSELYQFIWHKWIL